MADNTLLCLFGKKGSGKSTLAREIMEDWPRVVTLDLMGEYPGERAWGLRPCADLLVARGTQKKFRLSLTGFRPEEGIRLLRICQELRGALIVVEEAGAYCSPSVFPPELAELVYRGRHYGVSQLYVSQRPASIHRAITSQADVIVAFRQHEARDIAYLRSVLGDDADLLRDLPDYKIKCYGDLRKAPLAVLERLHSPS